MEVLILGAAGMVGQKLLNKLIIKKSINGKEIKKFSIIFYLKLNYAFYYILFNV